MTSTAGSALEVAADDSSEPTSRRRYRLEPPLTTSSGSHQDLVVVPGANATYAFSGSGDGEHPEVAAVLTHPQGDGSSESILGKLGYRVVENGVQRS